MNSDKCSSAKLVDSIRKAFAALKAGVKDFAEKRRAFIGKLSKRQRLIRGAVGAVLCVILAFLFVMYGPFTFLTDLYITTAMRTSDHQYLATMFYSDEYISKVLARNTVGDMEGLSEYAPSPYIGSDKIELTEVSGVGYSGYIITVYDETRIRFASAYSSNGELLEMLARRTDAAAGINAGGYKSNTNKAQASGLSIVNGKVSGDTSARSRSFIALDYSDHLYMGTLTTEEIISADFRDVIEFGPLLVLNGEPCEISGNGGGVAPRTAIGITEDRRVLLMVLEGRKGARFGASLRTVQELMLEHGAVSACNLDGGFSSSMYYEGEIISVSGAMNERMLPNAVLVDAAE